MRTYILPGSYHISHCATKPGGAEGMRAAVAAASAKMELQRVIADLSQRCPRLRPSNVPPMILIRIENDHSA